MVDLFADLLLLMLVAAMAPIYLVVVFLVLQSERGVVKAWTVVIVIVTVRLVQGAVFGLVFAPAVDAESAAGLKVIGPTLMTVAGLLMLTLGLKGLSNRNDDAAAQELPGWVTKLSGMSTLQLVGSTALLILLAMRHWVITLAAISIIEEAEPGLAASIGLYIVFTLATQVLVLLLILVRVIAPQKSAAPLRTTHDWLQRRGRTVFMAASLIFGAAMLVRGITGLVPISSM